MHRRRNGMYAWEGDGTEGEQDGANGSSLVRVRPPRRWRDECRPVAGRPALANSLKSFNQISSYGFSYRIQLELPNGRRVMLHSWKTSSEKECSNAYCGVCCARRHLKRQQRPQNPEAKSKKAEEREKQYREKYASNEI